MSKRNRYTEDELSEISEMNIRGFTVAVISEATGLSTSSISRISNGRI